MVYKNRAALVYHGNSSHLPAGITLLTNSRGKLIVYRPSFHPLPAPSTLLAISATAEPFSITKVEAFKIPDPLYAAQSTSLTA